MAAAPVGELVVVLALLAVDLRGVLTITIMLVVAGAIAYIGDRVGHHVGRRRMTLFGLRPRYTSTIFAVGFGMLIALLVIGVVALVSQEARQALFSINRLNEQIRTLTNERDNLLQDPVVMRAGEPLTPAFLLRSTDSEAEVENRLKLLFQGVANLSHNYPVMPYSTSVKSADAQIKIEQTAKYIKSLAPVSAIVVPVAGENIFRGGPWRFSLNVYKNALIYRKGEIITSVMVRNGKDISGDQAALINLNSAISRSAIAHGMPPMLADNPTTAPEVFNRAVERLTATNGPAIVKAVAARDIYAEGPLGAELIVSPR
ncbi:MAG: DUF3084 domain-containing protein [Candidatus Eremiobacteraeota bacterium]|nr:DUF3084 domain-containing protein [Candidatus Eremiobacteraeota bacterium]